MIELPAEAGSYESSLFEPNDDWLATVSKELQIAAMRRWFLERYEDPANETPWDGEDKKYVFIWGGPYNPNDEIQNRFSDVINHETMDELIVDLCLETGHEWAPIHHEGTEYEEYVSHLIINDRDDPHRFLRERISEIFSVLDAVTFEDVNKRLLHQMAHSSLIASLEAYLADTVTIGSTPMIEHFVAWSQLTRIFNRVHSLLQRFSSEWTRLRRRSKPTLPDLFGTGWTR